MKRKLGVVLFSQVYVEGGARGKLAYIERG